MVVTRQAESWTMSSLLLWGTERLTERGFDEARLHVEMLVSHALDLSRTKIYTNPGRFITREEWGKFRQVFNRRLDHEPLQYLVGETHFMSLPLWIDERVMIPRPETELLVEKTLEVMKDLPTATPKILDIGTGSGNIPIALAHFFPGARITSIDISQDALDVAQRNIERHGIRSVSLHRADIFADILPGAAFDIVVSNPPYVSLEEFQDLQPEVRNFEPRCAITDDSDGLRIITRIIDVAAHHLVHGGFLLLETAHDQEKKVCALLGERGFSRVEVSKDYSGIPRIVKAHRS